MKVLNISKVRRSDNREILLNGKSYPVSMTVENFLETTRAAEELANEPSLHKQVMATMDMITRSCPEIPIQELRALELEELQAVVAFIRGEDVEGVEATLAPADDGAEGDGKK